MKTKTFAQVYGSDEQTLAKQARRFKGLVEAFNRHFASKDVHLFSAPGRTEIGGNHTDHNQGRVLAASVNLDAIAAAKKSDTGRITILSEGYPHVFRVNLDDLAPKREERGTTNALIRGIAARLRELGGSVGGLDAYIASDVLPGSGLSSSAAVEMLICTILNTLYNDGKMPPQTLAAIGQYAENRYFAKPCGLMDQLTIALGGIVAIDFKDPEKPHIKKVDFDFYRQNFSLLVVNTGTSHADLTEDYAAIPREMRAVAQFLGREVCREIEYQELITNIRKLRRKVGDRAVLRALHFLEENRRVADQVKALEDRDFPLFLRLVQESGNSSLRWLQNCASPKDTAEQGITLALALTEQYIKKIGQGACRVHGGGFAGTIQVFLPNAALSEYITLMEAAFGKGCVRILAVRPLGACPLGPLLA